MHFPAGLCAQATAMNNLAAEDWAQAAALPGPPGAVCPALPGHSRTPGRRCGAGPGAQAQRRDMAAVRMLRRALGLCRGRAASGTGPAAVPQRIEEKRRAALLGGGQARIDAQHKRVNQQRWPAGTKPCPAAAGSPLAGEGRPCTAGLCSALGTRGYAWHLQTPLCAKLSSSSA